MAEIQIVYWADRWCDYNCPGYSMQCHTMAAEDMGCKYFIPDGPTVTEDGKKIIPFGDCARANSKYNRKGWSGKNYEMEEFSDPYNPHLDYMQVTLGRTTYDCVKVILDGKCIYNNYDDDKVEAKE